MGILLPSRGRWTQGRGCDEDRSLGQVRPCGLDEVHDIGQHDDRATHTGGEGRGGKGVETLEVDQITEVLGQDDNDNNVNAVALLGLQLWFNLLAAGDKDFTASPSYSAVELMSLAQSLFQHTATHFDILT